jgi:hypothetical protein
MLDHADTRSPTPAFKQQTPDQQEMGERIQSILY